jgi:hypothetical protein
VPPIPLKTHSFCCSKFVLLDMACLTSAQVTYCDSANTAENYHICTSCYDNCYMLGWHVVALRPSQCGLEDLLIVALAYSLSVATKLEQTQFRVTFQGQKDGINRCNVTRPKVQTKLYPGGILYRYPWPTWLGRTKNSAAGLGRGLRLAEGRRCYLTEQASSLMIVI